MPLNNATITERQLINLDKRVYSPKKIELNGRKYFQSIKCDPYQEAYGYDVIESTGKARRSGSRNTDTPVGDETRHRFLNPFTQFEYGIEFSDDELGRAQQVGDTNFVTRKGDQAARAMAEYENKVIFNGLEADGVVGLTEKPTKTGFAEEKPTSTLDAMTSDQILNYFKTVSHKITDLHYSTDKPILIITDAIETILDTPFNEYKDKTIEEYISKYFSRIDTIPELEAANTGRKQDMGMAFLNDYDTAGIPDAQPVHRVLNQHIDNRYKIKYQERFGGVAVRYQTHFVQLPDLIKGK